MEKIHQDILIRLRTNIINDLDVDNGVILPLTTEYILKEEDVKNINAGITKQERAGILLDILPRCGSLAFDAFHQSLKHQYEWLSDDIDELLGNSVSTRTNGVDCYPGLFNMPPISPLTVTREKKVDQLKIALTKLQPKEYIALHGMKGFGKSCLIASVLKDLKIAKDLFLNKIYWIKFGHENPIDEEILTQLTILYYNIRSLEILPESFTPPQKDVLIQFLKHHFSKTDNQNALLILDDVSDKKIINSFDFECKTLVLTVDIDVLRDKKPEIIEMNDGFSEIETLGLFANVLDISIHDLPIEAKKIHEECKGMPLLIAMFAAQFEEFKHDMKIRSDRWKYYLNSLKNKDATNRVIREFLEKQTAIFDMCIEQLKPDLRNCYEALAIFNEDVNITPKTLEILWERNIFEVEELMLELCHKSLAAKQWNNDLKIYVYGVHDLLLCHLREKLTQDKLTEMHKSVIKKYYKYCDNDLSKLPDDNYIYLYIGYHFEQAKLFDQLAKLYLNFDFIQAKIMYAGLSDLLIDLKKYGKYIINNHNDDYEAKISDMERFLQEQAGIIAEHRRKKCLDIIQIAMNHPYQGYVTQNARYLAMTRQQYLYLSHDKKLDHANMPLSEEISTGICTTSFTDNPNSILIGNSMGKIILWDCEKKKQSVFEGHDNSIKKIIVSKEGDCFLSLTNSGVVRLFRLHDEMLDENHMHVDSPKQKQRFWHELFGKENDHDDSLRKFLIKNEIILDVTFGHEDKYIVASTDKSTVQVWDRVGNPVITFNDDSIGPINKIAVTSQGTLLHIMDESKGASRTYANKGNEYEYVTLYGLQLYGKRIVFYHHIPKHDDSLMVVTENEAIYVKWFRSSNGGVHNFNKQVRAYLEDDAVTYVCATITYDGEYLIVADSAGFINVWHTDTGYQPIATYKSRVTSLDTYWLEDEGYHIICGNENRILHRWKLPIKESDALVRKSLFDAVVEPYDKIDIVVKENSANKLVVSCGEETIAESQSIEGKILSLQFSSDGKRVIYTTDNNIAALFDVETKQTRTIQKFSQPIQFLKILNVENNDIIIFRETDNELKVCQNIKVTSVVEKTGRVVCIHKLYNNHVLTITQDGIIAIWNIDSTWSLINKIAINPLFRVNGYISSSCYKKIYLAVLIELRHLILYTIYENSPIHMPIKYYNNHTFTQKITHFNISDNEQYIAVGFETGQISIIDIPQKREIQQLFFHSNPITQLSWAPINIGAPILASLTSDELVWWNIALANNAYNIKRRSRMGITHSTSTPSFSLNTNSDLQMSSSQSLATGMSHLKIDGDSNASTETHINDVSKYWMNKISKDPKLPGLLATVELPPTRIAKVCISKDFTKFLTVDIYGSVSIFKLFGYTK